MKNADIPSCGAVLEVTACEETWIFYVFHNIVSHALNKVSSIRINFSFQFVSVDTSSMIKQDYLYLSVFLFATGCSLACVLQVHVY